MLDCKEIISFSSTSYERSTLSYTNIYQFLKNLVINLLPLQINGKRFTNFIKELDYSGNEIMLNFLIRVICYKNNVFYSVNNKFHRNMIGAFCCLTNRTITMGALPIK